MSEHHLPELVGLMVLAAALLALRLAFVSLRRLAVADLLPRAA